jgi:hypothetical protein
MATNDMATNYMATALEHPHPEVQFAQVRDDATTALTQLADIFKNKFQKPRAPELTHTPLKAAENEQPAALAHPILTSPMHHKYQTRSQRPITANTASNMPVTPMMGQAASTRVPARTPNIPPRNLSQEDFLNMETTNLAIALGANHWSQQHFTQEVVHPVTGKKM